MNPHVKNYTIQHLAGSSVHRLIQGKDSFEHRLVLNKASIQLAAMLSTSDEEQRYDVLAEMITHLEFTAALAILRLKEQGVTLPTELKPKQKEREY